MKFMKIFAPIGLVAVIFLTYSFFTKTEKTGFVELQKVFQAFEGKIELENKLKQTQWNAQHYLDSLGLQLEQLNELAEKDKENKVLLAQIDQTNRQVSSIEQQAYEIQKKNSEDFTQQIWSQINQYVQDFGDEHNYEYIFGTEGAGILMYGSSEKDLTPEVINYINKKYHGE